jgi:ABC-type multidrug transport system ATPase subunit
MIEARHIRVARSGLTILEDASLKVDTGETVVLEGPSGSGKSTFVRVMATLVEPDAGEVLLDGVSAHQIAPTRFRARVAYLPQLPAMFPGTVADNVAVGPKLRGEPLPRERLLSLLERAELSPDFADREAKTLSGGERQRVALARALANEPEVLLLDEPTAALDPKTGLQIIALVRSLAKAGQTVVMVTHLPEHAEALGGSRYLCEGGRIHPRRSAA